MYSTNYNISFELFIEKVAISLNPGEKFQKTWYIDLMCECVKALTSGKVRRLIINIPPRCLKSTCFSVAWPAWTLGHDPCKRIIVGSYSQALSFKHSQECRFILEQAWYKELFPNTIIDKKCDTQRKFATTMHGFRLSTSMQGSLTGEGADIIIVDDPMNAQQSHSIKTREKIAFWYDTALLSRLNDHRKGIVLLVMQRLHKNDLTAHLLKKNSLYTAVSMPLYAEKEELIEFESFSYVRQAGDIMYRAFTQADLDELRKNTGVTSFTTQYQQNPEHADGTNYIKLEYFAYYDTVPDAAEYFISWDCANKGTLRNDYSVCTCWGVYESKYYLIDVIRVRYDYIKLREHAFSLAEKWNPEAIIVEDQAAGQQLIQELRSLAKYRIVPISPRHCKTDRLIKALCLFENHSVMLPDKASWKEEYTEELTTFPLNKYDDQVDSTTQFLIWHSFHRQRSLHNRPRVYVI